ncbi:MAG: hypothetical protein FRX48_08417 [Lasallia pustulata]|uniref:Uncharacterized protein n=1 Tax=Lasallia pustulata TaxID=136370 RepID=A0A5M8PGR4_9LECA|nr:MAG: hypothetical protein FRX48_08417 [Lasallia pustulata]
MAGTASFVTHTGTGLNPDSSPKSAYVQAAETAGMSVSGSHQARHILIMDWVQDIKLCTGWTKAAQTIPFTRMHYTEAVLAHIRTDQGGKKRCSFLKAAKKGDDEKKEKKGSTGGEQAMFMGLQA